MQKINNNISFKSNIHFVDKKTFDRIKKGVEIFVSPEMEMQRRKNFWTTEVKTCSAGGFVSDFDAVGFHCFDSKRNYEKSQRRAASVLNQIKNPKNGLLIGGKSHPKCPFSEIMFESLKKEFLNKVKDISIFEKHKKYYGESHLYYSRDNDTWWLLLKFRIFILKTITALLKSKLGNKLK
jgi:hypothetical protein